MRVDEAGEVVVVPAGRLAMSFVGALSLLRRITRWLLGTHGGAVRDKHLQAYLDEFAFRHNRRKTNGVGRIASRVIAQLVTRPPRTMRMLVDETRRCRWYGSVQKSA